MFTTRPEHYLCSLFLGALLIFPLFVNSQEKLQYSGPFQVGKYIGEANFTYRLTEGDTILDGPFTMQRSSLSALLENQDISFSFQGGFKDDFAHGDWYFQFGEFQSDQKTQVVDYQYQVMVSGVQQQARGSINEGKPQGLWNYEVNRIRDSKIEENLFKSAISFENGIPQKSFRIENNNSTLVGRFLRNGLAHDIWTLYSEDASETTESWQFSDGLLQKIEKETNGQIQALQVYDTPGSQTRIINLDERYITIIKLKLASGDNIGVFESSIQQLLAENARQYKKINDILGTLGKSDFLPQFKVKAPYFALDSVAVVQLDTVKRLYEQSEKLSRSLLDNSHLNILRLSDDNASFLYGALLAISEDFLEPLGELLGYHELGVLEFVSHDKLIKGLWSGALPSLNIEVPSEEDGIADRTFTGPAANQFNLSGNDIDAIYQLAQYTDLSVNFIQEQLKDRLTLEKRQQDLVVLEEKLIKQSKELNQFIDSLDTRLPKPENDALQRIKTLADKKLNRYAGLEETTLKIDFAKNTIACLEQLGRLSKSVASLPQQRDSIQARYQDAIWNPFTATIMNEVVKKRITTAYNRVLIPYVLNKIETDLTCENADDISLLIENIYKRMLEMRDESTSKLERKLRKEQNPEVVLQLFNLPIMGKEN